MKKPLNTIPHTSIPFHACRLAVGITCLAVLSACGGGGTTTGAVTTPATPVIPAPTGGTDTPVTTTPVTAPLTASQKRNAATTLVSQYAPSGQPVYTALSIIPTTASFTYNGYFYGDLSNRSDDVTDSLIGALQMGVKFTSTSADITGTITNFADGDNADVSGTLRLSNGTLNRNGNPNNDATLSATVAGTLTDGAGRKLDLGVRLEGDFLGAVPDGIGGEALGAVTIDGTSQDFDGGFIVER